MYFKEFREKIGISQKDVLQKLQMQQASLAKYELLKVSPSVDLKKKYCETLDANPNFLLFGTEPHLLSEVNKKTGLSEASLTLILHPVNKVDSSSIA